MAARLLLCAARRRRPDVSECCLLLHVCALLRVVLRSFFALLFGSLAIVGAVAHGCVLVAFDGGAQAPRRASQLSIGVFSVRFVAALRQRLRRLSRGKRRRVAAPLWCTTKIDKCS